MKHRKWSRLLALALSAVMLTACGQSGGAKEEPATAVAGGAAEGTETTKPTGEISYKTELNVAITANPPSLDVHGVNSNIVGGIGTHIYEPLFAMDANYEPAGVLADSYTISEDGKVYTIKLRQGVKFHNGQEMTADDVVASMSRWLELSGKAKALLAGTVFEKADDYTITMTLPELRRSTELWPGRGWIQWLICGAPWQAGWQRITGIGMKNKALHYDGRAFCCPGLFHQGTDAERAFAGPAETAVQHPVCDPQHR